MASCWKFFLSRLAKSGPRISIGNRSSNGRVRIHEDQIKFGARMATFPCNALPAKFLQSASYLGISGGTISREKPQGIHNH